ncbi:MAG TPA: asparagine synthase (glutamine-hydrolyzing) [Pyrinomonadaceae bacterium]|nr:asparagine synthase (glutamine-hydrolyzing) [Pyrinomonadaceae bacterium]
MCGICGVWEYGASEGTVEPSLLARMRDEMVHRGPDDSGELVFDDRRGGFGFRRLSIIDLSPAGHQPMHGCDEQTWLVFNGEIYNHAELRVDLEKRGHRYASRTDSETLLHLYEERGLDFIHDIEGDYAIALWDARREQLVLVRDRVGVKPLYFYHQNGRFIFASEIKAILQHPAVTADIDEESLYDYLTFLTTPAPSTLFSNIQKLPAGHFLILKRDGTITTQPYWNAIAPKDLPAADEAHHRAEILRLLRDSIRKRMMSDVPFGVFLSGGVDSSANVALMSELMTRPVDTFTVGFSDAPYLNELDSARRISQQFATNHHEVIISEKEMREFLPSLVFHQDEPIADPVCVPLYYVSKLARDSGTIVIQVGEGSDEIFSGYENYVRHLRIYESFWRHAEKLPLGLRRAVSNLSRPVLEATGRKRAAIELIRRLGAGEPLFWGGVVVYDESFKPRVLSRQMRERVNGLSSLQIVEQYLEEVEQEWPSSDFLARMTYLELKLRLPELLLMRVDKITMATSVEARVPFLDHHLVEYALGLPRSLKVEGTSGKHILKRALEEILPHDLLYERKRGFGAPVREWFREGLGGWFDEHLMNSTMRRRNLLDYDFVGRMLDEHRRQAKDWGFHLWALLNLSLWYERWIDPR